MPRLPPLPIDEALPGLLAALAAGPNAVLRAPPGAGKTTRVPPALLAAGRVPGRLVMLEPRRIAARAAAARIAAEQGWLVGREVGYQIRFERRAGPATRILVVTEGILVQMLQADPFLDGVDALLFDEVHERSLFTDLALAMARRVQREVRPELRLLAMSATLEQGPLAAFLGDCPVIESGGRPFPVEIVQLEHADERPLPAQTAAGVRRALAAVDGDLLVFLPGVGEIRAAETALAPLAAERDLLLAPLYGDLPAAEQDAVLAPQARRKVVLATNVAETSITIDGVRGVVDSGLARALRFDPATGLDRLQLGRISRAAADQRAGRAGRQAPGWCLRLWTAHQERGLPAFEKPEIARVDLAWPALQLLAWGEDPSRFAWFEAPEPAALARALELLDGLGARLPGGGISELGRTLARFPLHPRLARLLVEGARRGVADEAALAAALLSERDPFREAIRRGGAARTVASRSDLLDRVEALAGARRRGGRLGDDPGVDPGATRAVLRVAERLAEQAHHLGGAAASDRGRAAVTPEPSGAPARSSRSSRSSRPAAAASSTATASPLDREEALLRALLAAYPDRVARRREPEGPRAVLVGGRGARLAPTSAVTGAELFVALDLDAGRSGERAEALIRMASAIERAWLPPDRVRGGDELRFDPERARVVAVRRELYADLVLAEREVPVADAAAAAELLSAAAAADLGRALPLAEPEVAGLLARLRCLAAWMPELDLPRFTEPELVALLPTLCAGLRSFAELRAQPLSATLRGLLTHRQRAALDREAPERLTVPSGSAIRLGYEEGQPPVLAARIQELFGLAATPTIAGGRVPGLLHQLAPNPRPQQVTRDLASFWRNTYPEVRKELAGRYPKHAWPADPTTAPAERRPRRAGGK